MVRAGYSRQMSNSGAERFVTDTTGDKIQSCANYTPPHIIYGYLRIYKHIYTDICTDIYGYMYGYIRIQPVIRSHLVHQAMGLFTYYGGRQPPFPTTAMPPCYP